MTVPPTGESPSNKHHFNGHFPCAPGLASCPCTFIPHLFLTCANDRPKLFISSSTCMPSSLPQMSCLFSSTYLHQHTTCTNTLLNHKQTLCAVHFSFHTTYGNLCTITTCFLTYSTTTCTQHIRVPSTNSPVHSVMLPTQSDTAVIHQSLMLEATLQLLWPRHNTVCMYAWQHMYASLGLHRHLATWTWTCNLLFFMFCLFDLEMCSVA